jgi:steroid 5-alpha reductase family enzyme
MSLSQSYIHIVVAYVTALFFAGMTLALIDINPLINAFFANIIATAVIFAFSNYFKNSSFYDAYWSVIPPFIFLYWLASSESEIPFLRLFLVSALILYWSTRLTLNWAYHWKGIDHEDWRYVGLKKNNTEKALLLDFFGIHLFPSLQIFLGMLPVYALVHFGSASLNLMDFIAALVTAAAISLQLISDLQLSAFNRTKDAGDVLESGVWAWSRHPNYFGEIAFWFGLFLFGLAAAPGSFWWMWPGVAAITAMFVFVSIPLMEKRSLERRAHYQATIDRVSMLLPLPPKK